MVRNGHVFEVLALDWAVDLGLGQEGTMDSGLELDCVFSGSGSEEEIL